MDAIASLAGVSKPTIYKHFVDKQRLLTEIVHETIDRFTEPFYNEVVQLEDGGDVDEQLRDLATRLLAAVMQPQLLQLRRLVIGVAGRLQELGHTYEQRGPERAVSALTTAFERLHENGVLRLDDPSLAAAQFNWLVLAIPLNHAMLSGNDGPPREIEVQRYADAAVRVFLAAYRAA